MSAGRVLRWVGRWTVPVSGSRNWERGVVVLVVEGAVKVFWDSYLGVLD